MTNPFSDLCGGSERTVPKTPHCIDRTEAGLHERKSEDAGARGGEKRRGEHHNWCGRSHETTQDFAEMMGEGGACVRWYSEGVA